MVGISGTRDALNVTQWVFRYISPHYCLVKGLSDLQSSYNRAHQPNFPGAGALGGGGGGGGGGGSSPLALDVTGHHCIAMAVQTVVFFAMVRLSRTRLCVLPLLTHTVPPSLSVSLPHPPRCWRWNTRCRSARSTGRRGKCGGCDGTHTTPWLRRTPWTTNPTW
jgi:hypothetical protein